MPPDLYLRAESFSFQLQDNPFESNFKCNHMVWSGWGSVWGRVCVGQWVVRGVWSGWCRVCGGGVGCVEWVVQGVWSGWCRVCGGGVGCVEVV